MNTKIIKTTALLMLGVLTLTSCGEKEITKEEAQTLVAKQAAHVASDDFAVPTKLTVKSNIQTVDEKENSATVAAEIRLDFDKLYCYFKSSVNTSSSSINTESWFYVENTTIYSVSTVGNSYSTAELPNADAVKQAFSSAAKSIYDFKKTMSGFYSDLTATFESATSDNATFKSSGDGSLIFEMNLTIDSENYSIKAVIENYIFKSSKSTVEGSKMEMTSSLSCSISKPDLSKFTKA